MSQAKHWVFTLNNYTEDDVSQLSNRFARDEHDIAYVGWGREVGEEGTPHLQGFVSFRVRKRLAFVRTVVPGAHLEVCRGTPDQAIAYCEKDGEFTEFGERPVGRGNRSDLDAVKSLLDSGATIEDVAEQFFGTFLRFERGITRYVGMRAVPRSEAPNVRVHWGVSGSGKTRDAYAEIEVAQVYSHPGGCWFDGYSGQRRAIFDDFGGSEFKLTYLLKILDRYPMRVPVKGSFVNWCPLEIILTSNYPPEEWYPNAKDEHKRALLRRLTTVVHYSDPFHLLPQ